MKRSTLLCLSLTAILVSGCNWFNKSSSTSIEPPAPDYSEEIKSAIARRFESGDMIYHYTSSYYEANGEKETRAAYGDGFYAKFHDKSVEGYVRLEQDDDFYHSFTSYDFTNPKSTSTTISIGKRVDYWDEINNQFRNPQEWMDLSKFTTKSEVEGDRYAAAYSSYDEDNIRGYLQYCNTEHEKAGYADDITEIELIVSVNELSKVNFYTTNIDNERVWYATVTFTGQYANGYVIKNYAEDVNNIPKPLIFDVSKVSSYNGRAIYEGYKYKFEGMVVTPRTEFRSAISVDHAGYGFTFDDHTVGADYEGYYCDFTATIGSKDGYVVIKDVSFSYKGYNYASKYGYPCYTTNSGSEFRQWLLDCEYPYENNGTLVMCNNLIYQSYKSTGETFEINFTYLYEDTMIPVKYVFYSYDPDFALFENLWTPFCESQNVQQGVTKMSVEEAHFVYNNGDFFLGGNSTMTAFSVVKE